MSKDESIFEGFVPPTKNYFPMPNEWIDICSKIKSLAEIKVIFYILRHTWGFQEYGITKVISFDEFKSGRKRHDGTRMDSGTGLSRQAVIDGLNLAVRHGYIICEVDATDLARVKKSYALRMREVQNLDPVNNLDPQISGLNSVPQESNIYTPGVKKVDLCGLNTIPRSEKDTIERHLEKDTIERQGNASFGNDAAPAPENVISYENGLKRKTDPNLKAVNLSDSQQATGNDDFDTDAYEREVIGAFMGDDDDDDTPTEKVPAVRTDQLANTRAQGQSHISSQSSPQATSDKVINVEHGTDASKAIPKRSRGKKPVAIDEPPAPVPTPKSDTREIQARINAWRGYALEEKVKIIRERQAVKTWCNLHTVEEYDLVMRYLTTIDPYWRKEDNKYRIGGVELAIETPKALAAMTRRPMKAAANGDVAPVDEDYSDFDRYVGNGKEERVALLKEAEERLKNGILLW